MLHVAISPLWHRQSSKLEIVGGHKTASSTVFNLLRRELDSGTGSNLFISEAVRGPIELANVQALRGFRTGWASADHNAISGLQRILGHPDLDELRQIVQFELPALAIGIDQNERMRIDEMVLRDNTLDHHLPAAVVNTSNRMVHRKRKNQ